MAVDRDPALDAPTIGGTDGEGRCLDERFDLGQLVARGGMGEVHRGVDRHDGQPVAIKLMAAKFRADDDLRARFRREAEALASLDHPNIVRVIAIGEDDGRPFFVMPWIGGRTLADRIRTNGALESAAVVDAGRQLLDALAHIHAAGLVHRDVKPANFMLDDVSHGTLLDFGIARDPNHRVTETGATLGTPEFMAPEQARDPRLADAKSDLYSAGATLYAAWVGAPPFTGSSSYDVIRQHHDGAIPRPSKERTDLGRNIDAFVERAMAKDPNRRFVSADAMADALSRVEHGGGSRWWFVAAAAALALVVVGAVFMPSNESTPAIPVDQPVVDARVEVEPPKTTSTVAVRSVTAPATPPAKVVRAPPAPVRRRRSSPKPTTTPVAPEMATLRLVTLDRGLSTFAEVVVDDRPARHSPIANWRLPAGSHVVRVRRDGFVSVERKVRLEPGETKKLEIRLERVPR